VARLRSGAWCQRNQDDGEVSSGERAIAWGVIIGRLADGTRDTVFEQPTTESEAVTVGAIGEKTVVADAMEAVRQSVQQKAADELVGIECHHFGLAVRTEVFPGKADLPIGEREQPAIGDGDAMGVAAEIGQHLFGASERWLGVDHPVRWNSRRRRAKACGSAGLARLVKNRSLPAPKAFSSSCKNSRAI
jgi:hypothetical protein